MGLQSLTTEMRDTVTKLSAYFKSVADYLVSGTGTPAHFEDTYPTLSTDQVQETSQSIKLGVNGYSSGAISATLYETEALKREGSMVSMIKGQFYIAEATQLTADAEEASSDLAKKLNYIQGRSPEQNITI